MEKGKSNRVKEILLISYVLTGVVLIAMIWVTGLANTDPQDTQFYRGTSPIEDGIYYLTETAKAELGTVAPTRAHKNEHATPVPEATFTVTSTSTPEDILTSTSTPTEAVDQEN